MSQDLEPEEGDVIASEELGTIRLGRKIGQGGMGRVYEACRPSLPDATFAIKFLSPGLLDNPEALERFATEARRLSELRHRNIVRVLGYGLTKFGPCIQMELLRGRPLSKTLKSQKQQGKVLDRTLSCSIILGVLDGLQHVHERGLVHRDIKSANVFLETGDGELVAKLIDFGIVRETDIGRRTGKFVGTPATAAPEQLNGEAVGPWTDVYQTGLLAYIILAGRHPFEEAVREGFAGAARAHLTEPPPPLGPLVPDLPAEIGEAVMAMLHKQPAERLWRSRDGRPDGSVRAFRGPFRALARQIESEQTSRDGASVTHNRLLEIFRAAEDPLAVAVEPPPPALPPTEPPGAHEPVFRPASDAASVAAATATTPMPTVHVVRPATPPSTSPPPPSPPASEPPGMARALPMPEPAEVAAAVHLSVVTTTEGPIVEPAPPPPALPAATTHLIAVPPPVEAVHSSYISSVATSATMPHGAAKRRPAAIVAGSLMILLISAGAGALILSRRHAPASSASAASVDVAPAASPAASSTASSLPSPAEAPSAASPPSAPSLAAPSVATSASAAPASSPPAASASTLAAKPSAPQAPAHGAAHSSHPPAHQAGVPMWGLDVFKKDDHDASPPTRNKAGGFQRSL